MTITVAWLSTNATDCPVNVQDGSSGHGKTFGVDSDAWKICEYLEGLYKTRVFSKETTPQAYYTLLTLLTVNLDSEMLV